MALITVDISSSLFAFSVPLLWLGLVEPLGVKSLGFAGVSMMSDNSAEVNCKRLWDLLMSFFSA
jgi:hypothetical protein